MNIKYKFISTNVEENTVVVRYYTDAVTEQELGVQFNPDGSVLYARTDTNIMLPYPAPVGGTLDTLILSRAPYQWFENIERAKAGGTDPTIVAIGAAIGQEKIAGDASVNLAALPEAEQLALAKKRKLSDLTSWRYKKETSGLILFGAAVATDRESQAQLTGAMVSAQAGILTSVSWKDSNGVFVVLTAAQITALATAVANHVQDCFSAERTYSDQINACRTVAEVEAVTFA